MGKRVYNILHVISRLPVGGVEHMVLKVVRAYDPARFRAVVCCIREGGEIADELERLGFTVFILGRMKGRGFDWGAVTGLYRLMKEEQVDILRTHQYHANLYGRIAGALARVPVIVPSFHNLYRSPEEPKLHRRVFNHLLGLLSDRMVAVSHAVADDVMRYDRVRPEKVTVIHNGVAGEKFRIDVSKEDARKRLGLPAGGFLVGNAGRLSPQKGQECLIRAAAGLAVHLAIAGDGPLRKELAAVAEEDRVSCTFLGMLNQDSMPLFMRSLDLFCFPSVWEGMPSVLAEALTAGLPIAASDIPPNREVLGDAGMLFPAGDEAALRGMLAALMGDPGRLQALRRKSAERAGEFSIEKTVRAYEELFDELLRSKGLA
jgi:glycosyltransferase involved in cell wall biosynthesis